MGIEKRRKYPATLRASLVEYFETGSLTAAARDNPWLALTLRCWPAAAEARAAWQAGDQTRALELLGELPGDPDFLHGRR